MRGSPEVSRKRQVRREIGFVRAYFVSQGTSGRGRVGGGPGHGGMFCDIVSSLQLVAMGGCVDKRCLVSGGEGAERVRERAERMLWIGCGGVGSGGGRGAMYGFGSKSCIWVASDWMVARWI
jgi:hypothetical protein